MFHWTLISFVPLLLGIFAADVGALPASVTRMVVQDETILRVPILPHPYMPEIEWQEKKGPKCIPASSIRRALLSGSEQVDFILSDRTRIRAEFDEDCPGLDFYGGFYLQPEDERLCARRDAVHSRMGGSCRIDRFRLLVPKFRR